MHCKPSQLLTIQMKFDKKLSPISNSFPYPLLVICLAILIASSTSVTDLLHIYDQKRLIQFIAIASSIILTWVFYYEVTKNFIYRVNTTPIYILLIIITLGTLSLIHNEPNVYSILELSLLTLLSLTTISMASVISKNTYRCEIIIIAIIFLIVSIQTITVLSSYIATIANEIPLKNHDLFVNFANIRFFNQLQSWTFPIIILPIVLGVYFLKKYRYVFFAIASLWWTLLFVSGSRGTLFAIIVAIITSFIIFRKDAVLLIKHQAITAAIGLVTYIILFTTIPSYIYGTSSSMGLLRGTTYNRTYLWELSWKLSKENPLLGIGPHNFSCYSENAAHAHPHNAPLQFAAEWGIPAACLILFLFLYGTFHWVKQYKVNIKHYTKNQSLIRISLFASLIAGSIHSLFSGIVVMPISQLCMLLVIAWMLALYYKDILPAKPKKGIVNILLFASALSVATLSYNVYKSINFQIDTSNPGVIVLSSDNTFPRFWVNGKECSG